MSVVFKAGILRSSDIFLHIFSLMYLTKKDKFASPVEPADEDDDLILTEEQKTQLTGTQVKRKVGTVKLWPKGKVYFRFGPKARGVSPF